MVMYNPTIPVGEEKLALVRFLNVFNMFVARGDIVRSNEPGEPCVRFEMLAPDGVKFGVFQVRKLDESNPFRDLGQDAILFYGKMSSSMTLTWKPWMGCVMGVISLLSWRRTRCLVSLWSS